MSAERPRWAVGRCIFCPPSRSTTAKRYGYSEADEVGSWTWGPPITAYITRSRMDLCTPHGRQTQLASLALWVSDHAGSMAALRFDAIRLVRLASSIGKGPHIDAEELLKLGRSATEAGARACLRPGRRRPPLRAVKRPRGKELRKPRRYMATDRQEARVQALFRTGVQDSLQDAIARTDWRVVPSNDSA